MKVNAVTDTHLPLTKICDTGKPWPIMLNFLPIMLLSSAQNFAYYAQYYAHDYCNYATVCI